MKQSRMWRDYVPRNVRYLALTSAVLVFAVIVRGGMVRVTGAGGTCPDWPTCFGRWTPPVDNQALLDYLHRAATLLVVPFLLATALAAGVHHTRQLWIRRPLYLAVGLLAVQIVLGGLVSQGMLADSAIHLGFSLLILGLALVATVAAFRFETGTSEDQPVLRLTFRSPFARLSLAALAANVLLLASGALVSSSGAAAACSGWPLCSALDAAAPAAWIGLGHRLVVLLSGAILGTLTWRAWRTQRSQPAVLVAATAGFVLFFAQALLGAKLVVDFPLYLLGLHQATAVAVFGVLVAQVVLVGLGGRSSEEEALEAQAGVGRKGLLRDFLMLTKPIVVLLLLVTTFAGMVIGAQAWPPLSLVFWTLLGGFMAAGGSGAINQYIDRYDDTKMQRTQKRPIPSGRLTPGEGLAFGVALALGSFYLMTAFVNFTAALLSLAGIFYYVLLYSLLLKKTTVQNIVIGGGAGAIPPLVGWAAATGNLQVPALFLFAVVFMWTPPHFWALALVRRNDYARAGVPMLPVVRGEKETRWQIFLYTIALVALTLLLPLFGLGSSVYMVGAALLGLWLLYAAWKVWKQGGNKLAWKMYRYSSMYLAFLFVVLMVDRLL